jgi:hypothetical protein
LEELDHQRVKLLAKQISTPLSDTSSSPEGDELHPGWTSARDDL